MSKIVVVGKEDFTLGFELVGIEARPLKDLELLLSKTEDTGIIVILREDYDTLTLKVKNQIEKILKPIVVILSADDIKGNSLRDQIIKSLGVDLMK
ncbi:MAG: hypothetical protein KC589_04110 [Nanoarchaeota archaeon]|nr:hypothetical protein [Nanoarchaeota archaeon]MCA9496101.1 hypothetical protein [Nanoarchaeota archaeon]